MQFESKTEIKTTSESDPSPRVKRNASVGAKNDKRKPYSTQESSEYQDDDDFCDIWFKVKLLNTYSDS